jgi:hypothetical protein
VDIKTFLNARRIRDYPRLMLLTTFAILCINLLFRQGWVGGFGQMIGGDYLMFYSTGLLYRTDPTKIYDYAEQFRIQQSLVEPSTLSGLNPFMNPPYVAALFSLLTFLPLPWSFLAWTCLTIIFAALSVYLISPQVPKRLRLAGLTDKQYLIIILSFFPFIEGLIAGQNHGFTLMLVTGILVSAHKGRWGISGALAGALIYKPQLILGLLIVWAVWKNIKALAGFSAVVILWAGSYMLINGISPVLEYIQVSHFLMSLPYTEGFPGYIIITLYGLLTSILPASMAQILQFISQIVFILSAGLVAWLAFRQRKYQKSNQMPILALGLIFPLAFSPYAQLHDLLFIVPIFIIWASYDTSPRVFYAAVITYGGTFLLTLFAATTGVAWMALITMGLFLQMTRWNYSL